MAILIYTACEQRLAGQFKEVMDQVGHPAEQEFLDDLTQFEQRLRHHAAEIEAVVILTEKEIDLVGVLSLHALLLEQRTILIVPNDSHEITAMAHRLRPRYLTQIDQDFSNINVILDNLLKSSNTGKSNFLIQEKQSEKKVAGLKHT